VDLCHFTDVAETSLVARSLSLSCERHSFSCNFVAIKGSRLMLIVPFLKYHSASMLASNDSSVCHWRHRMTQILCFCMAIMTPG